MEHSRLCARWLSTTREVVPCNCGVDLSYRCTACGKVMPGSECAGTSMSLVRTFLCADAQCAGVCLPIPSGRLPVPVIYRPPWRVCTFHDSVVGILHRMAVTVRPYDQGESTCTGAGLAGTDTPIQVSAPVPVQRYVEESEAEALQRRTLELARDRVHLFRLTNQIACLPDLVSACIRMVVGITKQNAEGCYWYEGIEHDGAAEARQVFRKMMFTEDEYLEHQRADSPEG